MIARYGGVVEKFIGDAVMAIWGTPVATEGDAERAVRAALDVVAAVGELGEQVGASGLAARAGVTTGEVAVTVGVTGGGVAGGGVAGDVVNAAARVQTAAEPGSVWVDAAAHRLACAAIQFSDAGEHALKGKSEPVRLWRAARALSGVGGAQRVDGLEAPLTGRDAELRTVKELFHATAARSTPRLVVVSGPAGVGKSRLGWEFEKYVDGPAEGVFWHRGRCLSYGGWRSGRWPRSCASASGSPRRTRWLGDDEVLQPALSVLAGLRGDAETASAYSRLPVFRGSDDPQDLGSTLLTDAFVAALSGRHAEALRHARGVLGYAGAISMTHEAHTIAERLRAPPARPGG